MKRSRLSVAGLVLLVLIAINDLVGVIVTGGSGPEPLAVDIALGAFAILTLAAAVLAWRRRTTGIVVVVTTRVLAALLALPAFGADVPTWVLIEVTAYVVLTVTGIALLTIPLRRASRRAVGV